MSDTFVLFRPGADTYPGVLYRLSDEDYDAALIGARNWLSRQGYGSYAPDETWRVWNAVNALYEGGIEAYCDRVRYFAAILRDE